MYTVPLKLACVRACVRRACMCAHPHACTFPQDTHFQNIKIDLKKIRHFLKTLINLLSIVKLFSKWCIKNLNVLFLPKNENRKTALWGGVKYNYFNLIWIFVVEYTQSNVNKYIKEITIRVTKGFNNDIIISILGQAKNCFYPRLNMMDWQSKYGVQRE